MPVVQRLDNAIHRINHYPADSVVSLVNIYPLDSDSDPVDSFIQPLNNWGQYVIHRISDFVVYLRRQVSLKIL